MRGVLFLPLLLSCSGDDEAPPADGGTQVVTVTTEADLSWTDLERLEVEVDDGLIALGSFDTPQTTIDVGGGAADDTYDSSELDGVASVWAVCGTGERGCGMGFDITVPHDLTVLLSTSEGPVDVVGHEGSLNITSKGGPVTVVQRPTSRLVVSTVAGPVDVTYAEEPVEVAITTNSGDIVVNLPGEDYTLDLLSGGTVTEEGVRNVPGGPIIRLQSMTGSIVVRGTGS